MAAVVAQRARGPRLGIALSATAVCAAIKRPGESRVQAWRASLAPLNGDGSAWPGLSDALRTLARDAGITGGRLTIALMPPLAEARGVELPPLGDAELQQVLARGAGRYFVAARGAQVVGAIRGANRGDGPTVPTVAVSAGARLVNAIQDAATAAGWTVEAVLPAEAAWGAAAAHWASRARGTAQLLVANADRTDLLIVERSRLVGLRRFRTGADDASLIADAFSSTGGSLSIVGNPDARRELTRNLSARGLAVETPPGALTEITDHPDLLAASFATPDAAPALVTEAMRTRRAAFVHRVTVQLAIAAGILFVASGALQWWGLHRQLDSIKARRAVLAPQISQTLVGKTTVEKAMGQLSFLANEERSASRWSAAIAAISERLPQDAFLTGFRGRADSLSIDGLATESARVFDALEKTRGVTHVRSSGVGVRIEKPTDGPPMQRFSIAALIARPGTAKASPAGTPAGTPPTSAAPRAPAPKGGTP